MQGCLNPFFSAHLKSTSGYWQTLTPCSTSPRGKFKICPKAPLLQILFASVSDWVSPYAKYSLNCFTSFKSSTFFSRKRCWKLLLQTWVMVLRLQWLLHLNFSSRVAEPSISAVILFPGIDSGSRRCWNPKGKIEFWISWSKLHCSLKCKRLWFQD